MVDASHQKGVGIEQIKMTLFEGFSGAVPLLTHKKSQLGQTWLSGWYSWLLWGSKRGPWGDKLVIFYSKRVTGYDKFQRNSTFDGFKGAVCLITHEKHG